MKKLLLLVLISPWFVACNSGGGGGGNEPARLQFQGDLDRKAHEIYVTEYDDMYACDTKWKDEVLEVSRAVEANRENIMQMIRENASSNASATIIRVNGYDFVETANTVKPDLWQQERSSWREVYDAYLKAKHDPRHAWWPWINSEARSLILEDEARILESSHPGVRRTDKEKILRTYATIKQCFDNPTCTSIAFQSTDELWLREGAYHEYILDRMYSSDSFETKRRRIRFLEGDIGWAARRFGFSINSTIARDGNTLVVPMDLSVFGNDSLFFINRVEKIWSVHGLNLRVINAPNGFKVNISNTPGERAYVNFKNKLMQLFSPTRLTTVDHEFGHILGLMDTYYTSFDQNNCDYIFEFNEGDIMSSRGQVLPAHVQQIKQAYGLQ